MALNKKKSAPAFNVLDDADELIHEIWRGDIPAFKPHASIRPGAFFPDDPVIAETVRTLAELVYYSKQRARSSASSGGHQWIKAKFQNHDPARFLPGLQPLLERHFGELIGRDATNRADWGTLLESHANTDFMVNHFYIRAYENIPSQDDVDGFLRSCGIGPDERPESFDFLLQAYCRTHVRLDRLIALSHLIIAGAQSDTHVSHSALEHEHKLQELLKELRATYITEHATMQLAFAKRPFGLNMLAKLSAFSGFDAKHHMALSVIKERLSVGVEQFPVFLHATHKTQRLFRTIGQVLLGGFLATEVVKSLTEWASVYFHRNTYAYFIELEKIKMPSVIPEMDQLLGEYYRFEMFSVYASVLTVLAVIGVTLYFKLKSKSLPAQDEGHSGHHH